MTEKLKFTPVEGHVVVDFTNKKTKITPSRAVDIALRILSMQRADFLESYFHPVYIAMWEEKKKNELPENDNTPESPEPPVAA